MVMVSSTGLIKNSANTFAVFYRLIDFSVIQLALVIALLAYGTNYDQQYFVLALIATIIYIFFAESFTLYRSWRAGSFKEIVFYTFIAWGAAATAVLLFLFFSKSSEGFSRVSIAIWFTLTFFTLIFWP